MVFELLLCHSSVTFSLLNVVVVVVVVIVLCFNVCGNIEFIYDRCYVCHHHHHCGHLCDFISEVSGHILQIFL